MKLKPVGQYRIFSTHIFEERDEVTCDAFAIGDFRVDSSGNALRDAAAFKALARYWRAHGEVAARTAADYEPYQPYIIVGGRTIPVDHICAEVNGTIIQLHFTAACAYVHVGALRESARSPYRAWRLFASAMRKEALRRYAANSQPLVNGQRRIGFSLEQDDKGASTITPVYATLLVDGEPALKSHCYVFDLALVLAHGARTVSDAYPFTCGCGAPGCAGIHEATPFDVTETEVVWTFPDEPFRDAFRPGLVEEGKPLQLRFARAQYESALRRVTHQLAKIERKARRPVVVSPTGGFALRYEYENALPVRRQIREDRAQLLAYEQRCAWRERVWGDMLGQELRLDMPNGYVYSIPLENLGFALADKPGVDDEERNEAIEREIAPTLSKGLDAVVAAARTLRWLALEEHLFCDHSCPEEIENKCYQGLQEWPEVRFSLQPTRW